MKNFFTEDQIVEYKNEEYIMIQDIAKYYGISNKCISTLLERKSKIYNIEARVFKYPYLQKIKMYNKNIASKVSTLTLCTYHDFLKIAFLLKESEKSKIVVHYILENNPLFYSQLFDQQYSNRKSYENMYYEKLKTIFGDICSIQRQVRCEAYRIDFVVNKSLAIEIDENGHYGYDKKQEKIRERCILQNGYTLIRHNTKDNPDDLINKIVNQLFMCKAMQNKIA